MEILKSGNLKPRKFTCINCGCEFVANIKEYWRIDTFGVVDYECSCPECTYSPRTSEPWEEEDE